ncbi:MAG: DNA internalization-related competence protein ComEC/Rec2 [Acholeplasmataceae bacterium]|nr:DNA internalization-related competence protein ComEC/Rec2 [Acholeplasmataceae bacterium]
MKKLNPIYLWDDYYIEGFALFLLILGWFHPEIYLILLIYLYWQRRAIKMIVFLCAASALLIRYYVFENQEVPSKVLGSASVIDVKHLEYTDLITIKFDQMKFQTNVSQNEYHLGDEIVIDANVNLYREQTIPFGFNQKSYYLANHIRGYLDINSITLVAHHAHIYQLRESLDNYISNFSSHAYIRAFVLGEKSFSNEQSMLYRDLGVLYLFTISGLHIYGLMKLIRKIFFYLSLPERTQNYLTVALYFIFLYLNAFSMGILRIFLIYIIGKIIKFKKIEISHLDLIHIVFFFMLLINIQWVYHLGFLYTFIILNFLYLMKFRYDYYKGYLKRLIIIGIIIYAMLPFSLKITPFLFLLLPIIIFLLTSPFFLIALAVLFVPELDRLYLDLINIFEHFMQAIDNKNIVFNLHALHFYVIIIYYAILIFIFRSRSVFLFLKRNLFLVFLFSFYLIEYKISDEINFYMIDVGQGDSMLIQSNDCNIVIDSYRNVLPLIRDLGIYHLDYLILTHSDNDHTEEAQNIIDHINISHIIVNPYNSYPIQSNKISSMKSGDQIHCGQLDINFLGPIRKYDDTNNNSLVFKIEFGSKVFLFTGDIEDEAEQDLIQKYGLFLKSDVLKVAHHGSNTSSSEAFIHYVNPSVSLISVGDNNRFGFPNDEVITRLVTKQIIIYRTDNQGTIQYSFRQKKEKWVMYLPF